MLPWDREQERKGRRDGCCRGIGSRSVAVESANAGRQGVAVGFAIRSPTHRPVGSRRKREEETRGEQEKKRGRDPWGAGEKERKGPVGSRRKRE